VIEAARDYLQRGLAPIPVGPDKRPLVPWQPYQEEAPHADQVDEWWTRWPEANIGVVTGKVSRVVVLDADGAEGLTSLRALHTPATTWLSRTPRGGVHQWFRHPGGIIGNRAGVRPHVDVRADGGYVVVPPSLRVDGRRYEWLTPPDRCGLEPLPENVLGLLTTPAPAAAPLAADDVIPEGRRDDTLYRLTRSLLARGGLSSGAIHLAIAETNRARCLPPLSDHHVRELVEHALLQPDRPDFRAPTTPTMTTADGLGLVPIGDLLGEPAEAHAWIVEKRLPAGGLGMLAGKPKAGKSTGARCLALAVARGVPWLGFATTKGPGR
jgi:hypothetical protein